MKDLKIATQLKLLGLVAALISPHASANNEASSDDWCSPDELTYEQQLELVEKSKSWNESRGHFSSKDAAVYKGYPEEQLNALAEQGDLLAYWVMHGRILFDPQISYDEKRELFLDAAEQGSTYALLDLGYITLKSKPESEWDLEHVANSLTYIDVALRLGDYNAITRLNLFAREFEKKSDLNADRLDLKMISENSTRLLAQFNEGRERRGFDQFELSQPVDIAKFNAYLLPEESAPNWLKTMVESKIEVPSCLSGDR
jgi:hypothetical protein